MALFGTPEQHAANPPESWRVEKAGRVWIVLDAEDTVLCACPTRHEAEDAKVTGFWADLYEKERRWFAGEMVAGWKPYVTTTMKERTS